MKFQFSQAHNDVIKATDALANAVVSSPRSTTGQVGFVGLMRPQALQATIVKTFQIFAPFARNK